MVERGKILVVDDDQDVRDTLREYFEHSGFDVFVAGDGDGMRKVLAARAVDLILMDLSLPGEDGLTLTRELRSKHGIGIIMSTAAGDAENRSMRRLHLCQRAEKIAAQAPGPEEWSAVCGG